MIPFDPITLLRSRWLHYGLLALACAVLWLRGNVWEGRAERHEAAYDQLVVDTKQVSERAAILAAEAKQQTEDRYAELARRADARRDDLQGLHVRAGHYADNHRVQAGCVGASGQAAATPGVDAATGGDGPGSAAELVAIPKSDFDLIGGYVERLTRVRDWGQSLRDEGFAVVSETGE